MKKIKILQFPISNRKAGITQYILQNWKFIDKTKFQFDFATMSKVLDFSDELEKEGAKVFYLSCYAEDDENRFAEEFRKILLEGNYDIIHLHNKQWKSTWVEKIAKEVGVKKIIVHAHNTGIDVLDEEKMQKEMQLHEQVRNGLTEEIATDFWACSKAAADFMYGDKINKNNIKIMNNAVDITRFIYNEEIRKKYRKELGIDNKIVIGNVGRLAYQKNQEFLLAVFKTISSKCPNCILLLIGDGVKEPIYKQYVKDNGLDDKVIFFGYRKDVECLLQAIDIFALPSRYEGLPICAVEAQAAGLKCICSDKITEDVVITENIKLLPLEEELWIEEILRYTMDCKRKNMLEELTKAGYSQEKQIKYIEECYCDMAAL